MAAGRYLTSAWRTLSSAFTLDPSGERFAFARFRGGGGDEVAAAAADGGHGGAAAGLRAFDPGATELTEMNGAAAAAQRKKGDDDLPGKDASDLYSAEDYGYSDSESKHDRNRISAWQAGWNVTNAIQVKRSIYENMARETASLRVKIFILRRYRTLK